VMVDVLMIVAYLLIFIVAVFLITQIDSSKAEVKNEALKVDYNLELLNGLRTPLSLSEGSAITFAEFFSKVVDDFNCGLNSKDEALRTSEHVEYQNIMKQMTAFSKKLEEDNVCFAIEYAGIDDCQTLKMDFDYYLGFIPKCAGTENLASVQYPTQKKYMVKASLYKK